MKMNATKLRSCLIGVGVYALAPFAFAQAVIEHSVGELPALGAEEEVATAASSQQTGQLFLQIQRLQSEIQMLRGQLEEQAELIRQVEKQRFDDFVALDQRLVTLESGAPIATKSGGSVEPNTSSVSDNTARPVEPATVAVTQPAAVAVNTSAEQEAKDAYDIAYKTLRSADFASAKLLFEDFLAMYPDNDLSANAYYWLGELAIKEKDLETARQNFISVVNYFPNHRKANDANYKLGTVYYQLEQMTKSKQYFEAAASGSGQAAKLAQKALEKNF